MKRSLLGIALGAVLAIGLSACAGPDGVPGQTPIPILKAADAVLTVYGDIYQPAVLAYGRLPRCPAATICGDQTVVDRLKAIDAATVAVIVTAQPVLNGSMPDGGQVAAALSAVAAAQTQIAQSGALKLK